MKLLKFPADGKTMKKALKRKWPVKNDHDADDKKIPALGKKKRKTTGPIKHSGSFQGKSNALGQGGRAAQMRARGVPSGVIGTIARREGAAPGGPNYHKSKGKKK